MTGGTPGRIPIACNLDAFSPAQRLRHSALLARLGAEIVSTEELADGYAFEFGSDPGLVAEVSEWVSLERACCPFLKFGIELSPEKGRLRLSLTGGPPVKEFLRAEFVQFGV
jgi:hypothetical protein